MSNLIPPIHLLRFFLVSLFFIPAGQHLKGQDIPVGHWRHHLPNNEIIAIAETPDQIIGATRFGLVVFNRQDNSVEKINKVHGLSAFGINTLTYAEEQDAILIGYENGNLDIIQGKHFFNVPDIRRANILGSKAINNILVLDNTAYLACDFGIVEFNLDDLLIYDTFFIGEEGGLLNVNDIAFDGTYLYAATSEGLLKADVETANLADFQNWEKVTVTGLPNEVFNLAAFFDGRVFINQTTEEADYLYFQDEMGWDLFNPGNTDYFQEKRNLRSSGDYLLVSNYPSLDVFDKDLNLVQEVDDYYGGLARPFDGLYDSEGTLWIADRFYGMIRERGHQNFQKIILPGPRSSRAFGLDTGGGRLWLAPGARSYGGSKQWVATGISFFTGTNWYYFNNSSYPQLEGVSDIIRIAVSPANPDRIYAASWSDGVIELRPDTVIERYDDTNSPLQKRFQIEDRVFVGDIAFDRQNNLWITNSQVTHPLHVKKENGDWLSFDGGGVVASNQTIGDLIIDNQNQKWVIMNNNGIFLFLENSLDNANDFQARHLTTQSGNGNLPSNIVHSMAVDHNGYVWVGTDKGVGVFYSPQRAFTGDPFDAQRIIVETDGFAGYLLETETVTSIAVDGSNKKWFGTGRSGAFLLSADARETVFHFTEDNSPLPSNNILDISINPQNGEVFFATDKGLVSFRGLATEAPRQHTNVYAFPNPVRPGYDGYISVKGLVRNANVKITDINGNLVYETVAEGGQAIWNGQDLYGRRPSSGVYLVFSTNEDGSETMVTKILFIN